MIIQQVNLYQDNLKPKKINLEMPLYLAGLVLFGLILAALSVHLNNQLHKKQEAVAQAQKNLDAQSAALKQLQAKLPKPQSDAELVAEIKQWQQKVTNLTQSIAIFDKQTVMQKQGFSAYFQALAQQQLSELWLTSISLNAQPQLISLEGTTLQAEKIPSFLQQLQQTTAFHPYRFTDFAVQKSEQAPYFLNFKLATQAEAEKNHVK